MAPLQTLFASALALASVGSASVIPDFVGRSTPAAPTVHVKNGTYRGVHSTQYNQDYFLGIPYAQPPVGNLRFRQAQSLNSTWSGVRDAVKYSPECVGYGSDQWPYEISEDCLTLNVIRPAGYSSKTKLPVALWIHGGGFYMGGNADQRYNTSFIIKNSVDVGAPMMTVAINYRLSAWGFMSSDDMFGQGLLNIGLRDQRLALHWVQENIAAFGGDPERVTIWGESAGAASVGFHLQAYGGRDDKLFSAAVAESGGPIFYGALQGTQASQASYDAIINATNCADSFDKVQCLREMPFAELNTVLNSTLSSAMTPCLDGDFVQDYGSIQLERGTFVKVPLLIGANTNEGRGFLGPVNINNSQEFRNAISSATGISQSTVIPEGFKDLILEAYPNNWTELAIVDPAETWIGNSRGADFVRAAAYEGDLFFIGPRRFANEMWAKWGVKTYGYRFNAIAALLNNGIGHFTEVIYVFNNLNGVGYQSEAGTFEGLTEAHELLSDFMSKSWVGFFTHQDPNKFTGRSSAIGAWPAYDLDNPQDFVFDANVTSHAEADTWRKAGIDLINANAKGIYHR